MKTSIAAILSSTILSFGILSAGYFLAESRDADRYVTVKGVAEKDVVADLAVWPIRFTVTGDDLAVMQAQVDRNFESIKNFIKAKGIQEEPVLIKPDLTDIMAQSYRPEGKIANRFILTQPVLLRTANVDAVSELASSIGELTKQGIIMNDYNGPSYIFTGLNNIKPEMIAEATKNARKGAEQFAADSESDISGIRRANQGVFTILPRDGGDAYNEKTQKEKTVRVVSTIEYMLGKRP
ncbi:MAG: SIMPL domain-containing protein [Alphaproteobacteria bacterium]|nr:SIMPL domain-containing protein [Alphaproteobacteria bacterium]